MFIILAHEEGSDQQMMRDKQEGTVVVGGQYWRTGTASRDQYSAAQRKNFGRDEAMAAVAAAAAVEDSRAKG